MRQSQFGLILLVTGFIWLGVSIEAIAQTVPNLDKSKSISRILSKSQSTREIPLLSDVKRPRPSAQLLVQSPTPEIVQVTAVEANPTDQGVELILQTTVGEQLTVVNRSSGNSYIADIPNAQLRLPNGEVFEFRSQKPIAGITQITVTNTNANTIRVTVTGEAGVPTVELFDSDKEGLIFSVVSVAAFSPQGQQPQTPTPPGVKPGSETQPDEPLAEGEEEIEITVTATRTEEKLQDVPRSLTIINREQIEEQAQSTRDLGNILGKLVPGLSPPTQSSSSFGQTLRGRNVLVLIDGVPQSTSRNVFRDFSTIDPSAVERIEVLRGPTAIYGDGATGGVVNIITRTASEEKLTSTTEVGLNASLSHLNDSFGYNLRHSISGTDNNFDYTISAALAGSGGFFDADGDRIPPDPNGQGGLSDTDTFNILGKVGVNIGEGQRLQLTLNHFNDRQNTDFTTDPSVNRLPDRQKARALEGLDLEDNQGTRNTLINLEYNNEDLLGSQVRTQAYYRNYFTRFFPFDAQNTASLGNIIFQSELQSEKIGSRLEINTPLFSPETLSLLWGVDLSRENSSQPVAVFDPAIFNNSNGLVFREIDERSWTPAFSQNNLGLFAQLRWDVSDRIILNGGLRHERVGVSADDFTTIRGDSIGGGDLDYNATLFNIGAIYNVTEQVNLFANFAQGFSVADVGLALRNAPSGFSVESLRPEAQKVDHYEIGVRGNWDIVEASLVGFYNQSDLGTTFTAPGTISRSPQQVYGLEATFDVQPSETWQLGTTLSLVGGDLDSDDDGDYDAPLNTFSISPLKVTAYVENQTLPSWRNRLQLLYSGSRDPVGSGFGLNEVESYFTLDYISRINLGPGTLQVSVENLLNKQYFPVVSQLQTTDSSYAAARGTTLSVSYSFTW